MQTQTDQLGFGDVVAVGDRTGVVVRIGEDSLLVHLDGDERRHEYTRTVPLTDVTIVSPATRGTRKEAQQWL